MAVRKVLILGGYGNFGKRIAESLSAIKGITIVIAGRDIKKADALCEALSEKEALAELSAIAIDIHSLPFLYQIQTLANDRRFVCDISILNDQAKYKYVLIISGASSVPGLSYTGHPLTF